MSTYFKVRVYPEGTNGVRWYFDDPDRSIFHEELVIGADIVLSATLRNQDPVAFRSVLSGKPGVSAWMIFSDNKSMLGDAQNIVELTAIDRDSPELEFATQEDHGFFYLAESPGLNELVPVWLCDTLKVYWPEPPECLWVTVVYKPE